MAEPGANFLNPASIQIDPSLGVVSTGTTDIPPAAFDPATGEPMMPAAIAVGKPIQRKTFHKMGPGSTLAERLGTKAEAEALPEALPDHQLARPTEMTAPQRIVPRMSRVLSAEEMDEKMKPNWDKLGEVQEAIIDAATDEPDAYAAPVIDDPPSLQTAPLSKGAHVPSTVQLAALPRTFIKKYGVTKAAEFFGKTEATIESWMKDREPPLSAVQAVLDKSPPAQKQYLDVAERVFMEDTLEGSFSRDHTKEELPIDLCLAVKGDIPPVVHWVFTTAAAKYGLGQKMLTDTIIIRSRNLIADMFLKGKATWSLWLDADVLPTIGNEMWWRAIVRDSSVSSTTASYDFIKRFLSHNKPFVGGVYATRRREGPLVTQPDLHPRNKSDIQKSDEIRRNQAKGLLEVEWLSAGYCLVHRVVFETIRKKFPELTPKMAGEPYPFFTPTANEGEDVKLSMLARKAGFKLYLDTELFAAHIGRYAYTPSQSIHNGVVNTMNAQS
jgi:hypothetical protein